MKFGFDDTEFRHLDTVSGQKDRGAGTIRTAKDGKSIFSGLFRLILRITKVFRCPKEVQKCFPQILMYTAQRLTIHFGQEGRRFFIFSRGRDVMDIRCRIEFLHIGQHLIPEVTAAAESLFHQRGLCSIGIKPHFDDRVMGLSRWHSAAPFPAAHPAACYNRIIHYYPVFSTVFDDFRAAGQGGVRKILCSSHNPARGNLAKIYLTSAG